jgi:hypothetical protein
MNENKLETGNNSEAITKGKSLMTFKMNPPVADLAYFLLCVKKGNKMKERGERGISRYCKY